MTITQEAYLAFKSPKLLILTHQINSEIVPHFPLLPALEKKKISLP